MTYATLLAVLCTANAANIVRERTQRIHKSAAVSGASRLWSEEQDPFRRLQTAEDASLSSSISLSLSTPESSSLSLPETTEIPEYDVPETEETDTIADKEAAVSG